MHSTDNDWQDHEFMLDDKKNVLEAKRCGYVAIVGRPNVGKSTLLNHLLGKKVSITSRRPQTTRHQILGIHTRECIQTIYVDTPGMSSNTNRKIHKYMNKEAVKALMDVNLIVFVVDRCVWLQDDQWILNNIISAKCPVIVAVNKIDRVLHKNDLIEYFKILAGYAEFLAIVPISAQNGKNIKQLQDQISQKIPVGKHLFEKDQFTDRNSRFLVAELIREKIMRQLGDELPYSVAVEIESFKRVERSSGVLWDIQGSIFVERSGQKAIVIGNGGERLKKIGQEARLGMENLLGNKVMLRLWVKVRRGWSNDVRALQSLGYEYSG